jgi:hypothetical protein
VIHKKGYSIVGVLLFNITVSSIIVQQTKNKERTLLRCLSEKLVSLFNVYHSLFVCISNENSCLKRRYYACEFLMVKNIAKSNILL